MEAEVYPEILDDEITATLNELQDRMDIVENRARSAFEMSKEVARRFEQLADVVEYALGDVPVTRGQKVLVELKRTVKTGVRSGIFLSVLAGVGFGIRAILR